MIYRLFGLLFMAMFMTLAIMFSRAMFIQHPPTKTSVVTSDAERAQHYPDAVSHLSTALRFPTISDPRFYRQDAFDHFQSFVDQTYPAIKQHLIKRTFGHQSLLYEWKGSDPNSPAIILMSHYDVVPVEQSELPKWKQKPFSGDVKEGYIWGRGAIDDKFNVIAMLEAVNHLLKKGYQPTSTIYFAFGADEEMGGTQGNAITANYLIKQKINVAYVLDEGLPINQGIISSISAPIATIGVAEKGNLSVRLVSEGASGHTSVPAQNNNAITRLSEVIVALQKKPLPTRWNSVIDNMFHFLLPSMSFSYRLIFANLWLTKPFVLHTLLQNPTTSTLISTSISPTIIRGGIKDNVLPANAEASINFRLAPGDTMQTVLSYLHTIADPLHVKIFLYRNINRDPQPAADLNSAGFHILSDTIQAVFPNSVIAPSIMIAGTDSRFYLPLTKNIFRFYPWVATKKDIETIHGTNERIAVNSFLQSIHFYENLILNSNIHH